MYDYKHNIDVKKNVWQDHNIIILLQWNKDKLFVFKKIDYFIQIICAVVESYLWLRVFKPDWDLLPFVSDYDNE